MKNFLHFWKWDFLASNLKNFLYFKKQLAKPEKETKKSALKKLLVCYDAFAIFTAVKRRRNSL